MTVASPPIEEIPTDPKLARAIICDIDGTLAHMEGRSPYDYSKVAHDSIDETVREILMRYATNDPMNEQPDRIILVSGRPASCMEDTIKWLRRHQVPYDDLYMRTTGDVRQDAIVKHEIFDEHIRGKYNVMFVLDDRNRVVSMWRSLGLKVLQLRTEISRT